MTTKAEAVRAIQQQFAASFVATQIAYDNEPVVERSEPYVRITINFGETSPNLDSSYERSRGIVWLIVRVPKGRGDLIAWDLAEQCAAALRYKTFSGVRLTSADTTNVGILGDALEQDSSWFQINVTIPFWIERYTS